MIPIAVILSYILKFKMAWVFSSINLNIGKIYDHAQVEPYIKVMGIIVIVFILSGFMTGLYRQSKGILPEIDDTEVEKKSGKDLVSLIIDRKRKENNDKKK